MKKDTEQNIKCWFTEHQATYTEYGNLKVLCWEKPGTNIYMIRYVFDGNNMYVSGDLGEAVFCFTEKADLFIQSKYDLGYFESKLEAFSDPKRDFDSEKAVRNLREWLKEFKEDGEKYNHFHMEELFNAARECCTTSEWEHKVNCRSDFISELDPNYWEWMYNIGDVIPIRVQSYLIGLKMAAEQLNSNVA